MFCCRHLTITQKKKLKCKKHKFYGEKQQENTKTVLKIQNSILYSELAPLTRDVTCSKLSREEKKYR